MPIIPMTMPVYGSDTGPMQGPPTMPVSSQQEQPPPAPTDPAPTDGERALKVEPEKLAGKELVVEGKILNTGSYGYIPLLDAKLKYWFPENETFWKNEGSMIAWRNLFISQFNLMLGFAIWLMWSIIVVRIQKAHDKDKSVYNFDSWEKDMSDARYKSQLYILPAIAGLAGGTFRIPNSFIIMPVGGHVTVVLTTTLLCIPCLIAFPELQKKDASLTTLIVAAMFSGVGGGAFAASMSNISFFFPKSKQGIALGLNAGIGNLGVSLSQLFIPAVGTYAAFGDYGSPAGTRVYNGPMWWFPWCVIFLILGFLYQSDMPQHGNKPLLTRILYFCNMEGNAYIASGIAVGVFFATAGWAGADATGPAKVGRVFFLTFIAASIMHLLMWFASPADVKEKLRIQVAIFKNKHTWIMTWLYIMCFGSFIGYSGAFPKLIQDIFGYIPDPSPECQVEGANCAPITNPNAPAGIPTVGFAFLGPLIGSLIRPIGGWLSDRFGGALVTQIDIAIMIGATIGVGVVVEQAQKSDTPEKYFGTFLFFFLVLFATTGIANGSTFKQIAQIFLNIGQPEQAGPVLGWSSAIASYGAYIIPAVLGVAVAEKNVPRNMYGFAGYYVTCFFLNFWVYLRPGAETRC